MSNSEPRAKRQKTDKSARLSALEKLKQLKGSKHKYEVSETVDNVYEIVDEQEYAKKAKALYGDDWIEDDASGYVEDGRDFFEDEDDISGADIAKSSGKSNKKRPRDGGTKSKSVKGLSQRVLFGNVLPKKSTITSIKDDAVLTDLLKELRNESEKTVDTELVTSSKSATNHIVAPAISINSATMALNTKLCKEQMECTNSSIKIKQNDNSIESTSQINCNETACTNSSIKIKQNDNSIESTSQINCKETATKADMEKELIVESNLLAENLPTESIFEIDSETAFKNEDNNCFIENSDFFNQDVNDNIDDIVDAQMLNYCTTEDDNEDILKFWYWEAWEDSLRHSGEVYLFGRTLDGKSICVRVEKIDRVLYFLPREYLLDETTKESTKQKATLADLYKEFSETIATDLNLVHYRSRKVTKNFAYHSIGVDVPFQCDYMEVQYDGNKPVPKLKKYNSIAHIFGANTTALERFILERKIKGPCWLQIKQYKQNTEIMSWCKVNVVVSEPKYICLLEESKPTPPPPITLLTLNVRTVLNTTSLKNEICAISMLVHNRYHIDKSAPTPPFNRHMCGITRPTQCTWPLDINDKISKSSFTKIIKHNSERSLLCWFLAQYQQIDADLIITFDSIDCQLDAITERILNLKIPQWSRLGRLRLTNSQGKRMLDFFVGRMVCDVKRSAEECIRSRSYDLSTLCENVLALKNVKRLNITEEIALEMYETSDGIVKLITSLMQDASYILRLMYELNIMPLTLQITKICGNMMTRTLQSGRSERNEYLLLHAFTERNYIVPDKRKFNKNLIYDDKDFNDDTHNADNGIISNASNSTNLVSGRKKAAYSGGLVLDPISGLYDKYILLLDYNSLYPSLIQEYNICFTTVQQPYNVGELPELPEPNAELGILPQQLRRLVESRRQVKQLMAAPNLLPDQKLTYHIRQMALKLTANSMYGCLGFSHSRFFAQHLAALVTHKGREILLNTKTMVEKMNYNVVYGDTDSIMVNTNIKNFDEALKIGNNIKRHINKLYKGLELDIDGIFSCLLLLKKKKYAAIKITKTTKGDLIKEKELKGLDIVRRDWSQIAIVAGNTILDEILSDKSLDEKLHNICVYLEDIRDKLHNNKISLPMFIITKQLSKAPRDFDNATSQSHALVAKRMNVTRNRRYKRGDMVDYVICEDGTSNPPPQRAYHMDELESSETLKVDINYYLAHQIHPVVTRLVEFLEGMDASRIAECLGLDAAKFRKLSQKLQQRQQFEDVNDGNNLMKTSTQKYRMCEKFKFICRECKAENMMASAFRPIANNLHEPVLQKCCNPDCSAAPYEYIMDIRNQLALAMRSYINRFYKNWMVCDDPTCNENTRSYTHVMISNRLLCMYCKNGYLVRQYTERDLYTQLDYFRFIFDLEKQPQKNVKLIKEVTAAYQTLYDVVSRQLEKSAYCEISLGKLFYRYSRNCMLDRQLPKDIPTC